MTSLEASSSSENLRDFIRCYSHITGIQPSLDHPLWMPVKSGELDAAEACMEIFDKSTLSGSGIARGIVSNPSTPQELLDRMEAQSTLRNFQAFHRSWFVNDNFREGARTESLTGDADIYDHAEAANHVSWLLFSEGEPYSQLLTGIRSIRALRAGDTNQDSTKAPFSQALLSNFRHNFQANPTQGLPLNPLVLERGTLRGFRELTETEMSAEVRAALEFETDFSESIPLHYLRPQGAGAMGTASYLLINLGLGVYIGSNGGNLTPRRLLQAALTEFMCRVPPVISGTDAQPYVRTLSQPGYGELHSWQRSSSCMSCHTTLDGAAAGLRNLTVATSGAFSKGAFFGDKISDILFIKTEPTQPTANGVHEPAPYLPQEPDLFGIGADANFARRPPKGKFVMRDYNNTLISEEFLGIEGLGNKLVSVDDFYLCAASRYYGFFTGYTPPLLDIPTSSRKEIQARQEMIQLGLQLKNHQSLRELIRGILESDLYREGLN